VLVALAARAHDRLRRVLPLRRRRRLVQGERRAEAAQRSARLVLPIVFTAGLIVAVGSASLVIGSLDFFRASGPGWP
jgi:hypothetical protein